MASTCTVLTLKLPSFNNTLSSEIKSGSNTPVYFANATPTGLPQASRR